MSISRPIDHIPRAAKKVGIMKKINRIGPQMKAAVNFVLQHPGTAIYPVAKHLHRAVRNGKNNALGYEPVHRAIKAGLIKSQWLNNRYSLTSDAMPF